MSTKALVIALVVTLGLVGVALLVSGRGKTAAPQGPAPGAGTPVASDPAAPLFTPGLVTAIEVQRPGRRSERVERSESGEWNYRAGALSWPASVPELALASLAALADELAKPGDASPAPADGGPVLTFAMRDGGAVAMRLSATPIGGLTAASITTSSGTKSRRVENSVLDPLLNPGPAGWRLKDAIPSAADASRVTLDDARTSLALAKIDGLWSMRRPISARASQNAVSQLLGALAAMKVERFEDPAQPDLASMGLTRPVLTVGLEMDRRVADAAGAVRVQTSVRELIVGGPADPKGDTRYASADADGSVIMVVSAAAVNALSLAPRNYLYPSAVTTPAAEVFMVTIRDTTAAVGGASDRGFRREAPAGWSKLNLDGSRGSADAEQVDELLEFLSARPGEPDAVSPDDEVRVLRRVELIDAEGDPREVLSVGYTADGQVAVRSGNLLVSYRASDAPRLLDLPAFETLPPVQPAPPAPTMPPGSPATK